MRNKLNKIANNIKKSAKERRYVAIHIPGTNNYVVFDKQTKRSVEKCKNGKDATIKARQWENNEPVTESSVKKAKKFPDVIGKVTTFIGKKEHPYLRGHKVRIIGIMRNAARPDYNPDNESQYEYISENEILAERGPVSKWDRVEVQPWIEKAQRFSFVTSDPKATDLACFKNLKK